MNRLRRFLWHPGGWMLFQLVELFVVGWLFSLVLPNDLRGPAAAAVAVALLIVLFALNLWVRTRFFFPGSQGDSANPHG